MEYRMICIDIDGTLIRSDREIGSRTKQAIQEACRLGYIVTLVTGRRYTSALPYAKELDLKLPIICFNGGLIVDSSNDRVFHAEALTKDYAHQVISAWQNFAAPVFAFNHSRTPPHVLHQNYHPRIKRYLEHEGNNIVTVDNLITAMQWSPLKLMTYGSQETTERCYYELTHLYNPSDVRALLMMSDYDDTCYLEICNANATKSNGLRWLSNYYQIPQQQIIAFGDNLNDLDMLEWAGLGVAMGNAVSEVKAFANLVTDDNDNDGIAQALVRILGISC